ncbi:blood vessel epicardial substance-like [Plectropomus leopardus]|uniref:blood vessel epicardial substance-like n=1 Tax=Plectropomus leopardus TaxID=160734 RepID=UPI001C4AE33F|nr:blood vessel epicardial substance-like [Plectropomus leopardus]
MSSAPELPTALFTTLPTFPSATPGIPAMELNATSCQEWEQAHHLLFHLGSLSLLLGLVIPTTLSLHMILLRLLLMTGLSTAPPADTIPLLITLNIITALTL